jgi:hypothetical protein
MMTISSVGLDQLAGTSGWRSSVRQAGQDLDQLSQSLQTGNLNAAQQAYSSFQQVQAGLTSSAATQANAVSATTASNPVTSDWSALGQALQSGSLAAAQDALGKLQQDAQATWQSQLQQQVQNAQSVYALMQSAQGAAATPAATAVSPASTAGSVQGDLNSLNQALQSGDISAAQKLLTQLQQDLQASGQNYGGHHHHHHHGGFAGQNASSAYLSTAPVTSAISTPVGSTGATSSSGISAKA